MKYIVLRFWINPKEISNEQYQRRVSVFARKSDALTCLKSDKSRYADDIVKSWQMTWKILPVKKMCYYALFGDNGGIDGYSRTKMYRKLDATKFKHHCPPFIKAESALVYEVKKSEWTCLEDYKERQREIAYMKKKNLV